VKSILNVLHCYIIKSLLVTESVKLIENIQNNISGRGGRCMTLIWIHRWPSAATFNTRIKYYYNIRIWCLNKETFNVCQPIPLDGNTSAGKVYLAQMAAVVRIIMTRIGSDHVTCAKTFWTAFWPLNPLNTGHKSAHFSESIHYEIKDDISIGLTI